MQNMESNLKNYIFSSTKSIKDYILLVRTNLKPFIIIPLIIFIVSLAYAIYAPSIYRSTVTLKIIEQKQTVLKSESLPEVRIENSDRFIANEIEVIENFDTRERVAKALIDTFENAKDKNIFNLLSLKENEKGINGHKTLTDIAGLLMTKVKAEQKSGMDVVEISAESTSPKEAALIANTYADQYVNLNFEENRNQLNVVRKFLEKQSQEKLAQLNNAENELANFKEKGGIVALDAQSAGIISQLSQQIGRAHV